MNKDEPLVVIDKLSKAYGSFVALDSLSLTVNRGRILGFIGPNGAGKTTTIKILVGQASPTSGSAKVCGADCTSEADRIKQLVGYMPDTFGAYDNMRVSEYLDFFGAAFNIPRRERKVRIGEVMETANVTHMKDLYVESLSHGMKQRVGIARTLLHNPELLILDEPANGLDPQARIEIRQLLLKLAEMGKTLIVTSHILPELSRICNDVAIVSHGKLRAFGSLESILRKINQQRILEILLPQADPLEPLAAHLRQRFEAGAKIEVSVPELTIRLQTIADDAAMQKALAEMIGKGFPVLQFREVQLDLEDTFMTVTRGGAPESTVETVMANGRGGRK